MSALLGDAINNLSGLLRSGPAASYFQDRSGLVGIEPARDAISPQVSVSSEPLEVLEGALNKRLPARANADAVPLNDFSPQAVAGRVLGFIEAAVAQRAGSDIEAQSLLQQAREGVAQGFAEAREQLNQLAQLSGTANAQLGPQTDARINETQALISQGLDHLQGLGDGLNGGAGGGTPITLSESASLRREFKQSNEASINIVTREGDRVEVRFSARFESAEQQRFNYQNPNGSVNSLGNSLGNNVTNAEFSASAFSASSVSFDFSVNGNIDEVERDAINRLLSEVGELATQFFKGDVQAAFDSALSLGFDQNALQSFALDFQQNTSVSVVQTYQRTQQFSENEGRGTDFASGLLNRDDSNSARSNSLRTAVDVLSQLNQLLEQSREAARIQQPDNTIKSLLVGLLGRIEQGDGGVLQNYINKAIEGV